MFRPSIDLLLYNANVITLDKSYPRANWISSSQGRIHRFGNGQPPSSLVNNSARNVNCHGGTILPGFNDAHCHVLASAASALAVDCGPKRVKSIDDIKSKLRAHSKGVSKGSWIRATGYDEFRLSEGRHPSKWDLDEVTIDHPVKLVHRSGHAVVLNSAALKMVSIDVRTGDLVGGYIDRHIETGEPTGLLLHMDDYLDGMIPMISRGELTEGIREFNNRCLAAGITSIQDASVVNDLGRWNTFVDFKERDLITPSVTFMIGFDHMDDFLAHGLYAGYGSDDLRIGAVKLVVTTGDRLSLNSEMLRESVEKVHRNGFQVAIHAIEVEAVEASINAIKSCDDGCSLITRRHRIEHCSECPPNVVNSMADSGIVVVTQPGFVYYSGDRYISNVSANRQQWLYPVHSLRSAGVVVALSSDSPVIPLNPMMDLFAGVNRLTERGELLLSHEAHPIEDLLAMYSYSGAYASFRENVTGSVVVGKKMDLVVLDNDPTSVDPVFIKDINVLCTVVGGVIAWQR